MEHWWREKRGIVDHVTGAGKTLTALWIIRDWLQNLAHAALILVPSSLLAQQWEREIRSELADLDVRLLRVGGEGGSKRWGNLLTTFSHPRNSRHPKVVLATMQTACKAEFLERLTVGRHLLVVADEVHRVGSPTHLSLLKISSGAALGLSATPERFFDPNGTQEIFDYFGPVLEPPFRIVDAQKARRLVPYDFFVHYVTLNGVGVRRTQETHDSHRSTVPNDHQNRRYVCQGNVGTSAPATRSDSKDRRIQGRNRRNDNASELSKTTRTTMACVLRQSRPASSYS